MRFSKWSLKIFLIVLYSNYILTQKSVQFRCDTSKFRCCYCMSSPYSEENLRLWDCPVRPLCKSGIVTCLFQMGRVKCWAGLPRISWKILVKAKYGKIYCKYPGSFPQPVLGETCNPPLGYGLSCLSTSTLQTWERRILCPCLQFLCGVNACMLV